MKTLVFSVPLLAAALLMGGPTPTPMPTGTPSPTPAAVTLQYLGTSCTLIIAPDGTRIISDPYGSYAHPSGLVRLPKDLTANAVTVSHTHSDHSNTKAIGGSPEIIDSPGTYQVGMVTVTGYAGREGSPTGPSTTMANTVFVFEVEGIKIVHLGDSGVVTDPDVLAGIQNADVILVNIDGYVILADQIIPFMQQAQARTVIPTHYSLSEKRRWQGAPTAEEFIATLPAEMAVTRAETEIQVTPDMPVQVLTMVPLMLK